MMFQPLLTPSPLLHFFLLSSVPPLRLVPFHPINAPCIFTHAFFLASSSVCSTPHAVRHSLAPISFNPSPSFNIFPLPFLFISSLAPSRTLFFYLPARPSRHLLRVPSPNHSSPESRLSKPIFFPSTLVALSITHFAKRCLPVLLSQIPLLCILPNFYLIAASSSSSPPLCCSIPPSRSMIRYRPHATCFPFSRLASLHAFQTFASSP